MKENKQKETDREKLERFVKEFGDTAKDELKKAGKGVVGTFTLTTLATIYFGKGVGTWRNNNSKYSVGMWLVGGITLTLLLAEVLKNTVYYICEYQDSKKYQREAKQMLKELPSQES